MALWLCGNEVSEIFGFHKPVSKKFLTGYVLFTLLS